MPTSNATKQNLSPLQYLDSFSAQDYLANNQDAKVFGIYQDLKKSYGAEFEPMMKGGKPETMKEWSIRAMLKICESNGVEIL